MKNLILLTLILVVNQGTFAQLRKTTGSLPKGHANHQAQLLNNGNVLLFGGDDDYGTKYNTAYLYNPSTGKWTATGSMNEARSNFASVLLDNGNVLAIGSGTTGKTCEIYNVSSGTWNYTGSLDSSMEFHYAVKLKNGKIFTTGSYSCELYDQTTNTWSITTLKPSPLYQTLVVLNDGKVLAVGGLSSDEGSVYDPTTQTWTNVTNTLADYMNQPSAILLDNGKVLILGYPWITKTNLYNPATNSFEVTGDLSDSYYGSPMVKLNNGNILIYGIEIYKPSTGTWVIQGTSVSTIHFHTLTPLANGKFLVAGGVSLMGANSSCYIIDPSYIGIEENKLTDNNLKLWMNTTSNQICIESTVPISEVEIFNIQGCLIQKNTFNSCFQCNIELGIIPKGIYLLKVRSDIGVMTERLVVE